MKFDLMQARMNSSRKMMLEFAGKEAISMENYEETIKDDKDTSSTSQSNSEQSCCDDAESCGYDDDPCECYTESCCC
jgi:hypothetical protein